jgi:hypothetical protein
MKSKLSSPKVIIILGLIAVGLVAAVGWFGLVSPQKSRASKLDAQITDVTSQAALVRVDTQKTRGQGKTTREKLHLLAVAMPNDLRMAAVMRELIWHARRANVSLDAVKPAAGKAGTGYYTVPVDVTVTGRYFDVERFLKRLRLQSSASGDRVRASGRLLDVAGLDFQPAQQDDSRITATLHSNVFVYSPSATSATAPVSTPSTESTDTESASAAGSTP